MEEEAIKRLIIDVDAGTDDYLAILLLLKPEEARKVKIEAITCTSGNTTIDNVCKNVLRLLEITKRTDIPVYKGASRQILGPAREVVHFRGADGFGDLKHEKQTDLNLIKAENGIIAIRNIVVSAPGEISLVCVAPLTNLALAVRLYDDFATNLKDLWIMGGNYTARGSVTSCAEHNIYMDPEAAFIVFDTVTKPIYILTYEGCLKPNISLDWFCNVFGSKLNPEIQLLVQAEKKVYTEQNNPIWKSCDAFLVAAFINPEKLITKQAVQHVTVELNGTETRGQIVVDHLKRKRANVTIIEEINSELFKSLILQL